MNNARGFSKYEYKPCVYCGQVVAHAKVHGKALHSHRWSQKCKDGQAAREKKHATGRCAAGDTETPRSPNPDGWPVHPWAEPLATNNLGAAVGLPSAPKASKPPEGLTSEEWRDIANGREDDETRAKIGLLPRTAEAKPNCTYCLNEGECVMCRRSASANPRDDSAIEETMKRWACYHKPTCASSDAHDALQYERAQRSARVPNDALLADLHAYLERVLAWYEGDQLPGEHDAKDLILRVVERQRSASAQKDKTSEVSKTESGAPLSSEVSAVNLGTEEPRKASSPLADRYSGESAVLGTGSPWAADPLQASRCARCRVVTDMPHAFDFACKDRGPHEWRTMVQQRTSAATAVEADEAMAEAGARVEMLDAVCKWLASHGYKPAADEVFAERGRWLYPEHPEHWTRDEEHIKRAAAGASADNKGHACPAAIDAEIAHVAQAAEPMIRKYVPEGRRYVDELHRLLAKRQEVLRSTFTGGYAPGNETPNNRSVSSGEGVPGLGATHQAAANREGADSGGRGPSSGIDSSVDREPGGRDAASDAALRPRHGGGTGLDAEQTPRPVTASLPCASEPSGVGQTAIAPLLALADELDGVADKASDDNEAHWQPLYEACRHAVRAWERDNATCSHDVTVAMQTLKIATTQAGRPSRPDALLAEKDAADIPSADTHWLCCCNSWHPRGVTHNGVPEQRRESPRPAVLDAPGHPRCGCGSLSQTEVGLCLACAVKELNATPDEDARNACATCKGCLVAGDACSIHGTPVAHSSCAPSATNVKGKADGR